MNTPLTTTIVAATTIVLGTFSPAGAIPDPEPRYSPTERIAVSYPFGAGSSPDQHVAGQDWLPARRVG